MKKEIWKISQYKIILVVLLLFLIKFFYLIQNSNNPLMELCAGDKQTGLVLVILVVGMIYLIHARGKLKRIKNCEDWISFSIIPFWICECISSIFKYDSQSVSTILLASIYLLVFLLFSVLKCYTSDSTIRFTWTIKAITYISLIWAILLLAQSIIFAINKTFFMNIQIFQNGEGVTFIRNNMLRCGENSTFLAFSFTLSYSILISMHHQKYQLLGNKMLHLINTIISGITILFVCQTRVLTAGLLVILVVGVILRPFKKSIIKLCIVILLLFVSGVFLLSNNSILTEFLSYDITEKSYVARMGAYPYYFKLFVSHPFLGIGIVTGEDGIGLNLLRGPLGMYYTSDCGLIGSMAKFGIYPLIIVFIVVLKLFKEYFNKRSVGYKSLILINQAILILIYCTTLSCYEVQSIYLIPFILYIEWGVCKFAKINL